MNLYQLHRGNAPLIVDVPHAGTYLPADIEARLTPLARTVPDTDWHVDKLYSFVHDAGATLMTATHSRIVVDLNRDPSGSLSASSYRASGQGGSMPIIIQPGTRLSSCRMCDG